MSCVMNTAPSSHLEGRRGPLHFTLLQTMDDTIGVPTMTASGHIWGGRDEGYALIKGAGQDQDRRV
jgi:hypothetical protein